MSAFKFPPEHSKKSPIFDLEEVDLPYDLPLAMAVYAAYVNHGILPEAGGFLNQPRSFLHLLNVFGSIYAGLDEPVAEDLDVSQLPSDALPITSFDSFRR